jgi:hypothetical protein
MLNNSGFDKTTRQEESPHFPPAVNQVQSNAEPTAIKFPSDILILCHQDYTLTQCRDKGKAIPVTCRGGL